MKRFILLFVLLSGTLHGQEIKNLENVRKLPDSEYSSSTVVGDSRNNFVPVVRPVSWEEIKRGGTEKIYLKEDASLIRIKDNKKITFTDGKFVTVFSQPDEHGFKYILSKNNSIDFKVHLSHLEPVKLVRELYEPPIFMKKYDRSLRLTPEASIRTGFQKGDFIKDIFIGASGKGYSQQYSASLFTEWELPIKVGLSLSLENAIYSLDNGGKVYYSSPSFGPLFQSQDVSIGEDFLLRAAMELRYSPFARARSESESGDQNLKFNSTDFFMSIKHPIENSLGSFLVGVFYQFQWLNLKSQDELVSIRTSQATNKSFGLSFSQAFE
jgi:hypothetical protein